MEAPTWGVCRPISVTCEVVGGAAQCKIGPHRGEPPGAEPAAAADQCSYNTCLCGPVRAIPLGNLVTFAACAWGPFRGGWWLRDLGAARRQSARARRSQSHAKWPLTTPGVKFGPPGAEPAAAADRCHYNTCLCGPVCGGAWAPGRCPEHSPCRPVRRMRRQAAPPRRQRLGLRPPSRLSACGGAAPVSGQRQPDQASRHALVGAGIADVMRRLCPQRGATPPPWGCTVVQRDRWQTNALV